MSSFELSKIKPKQRGKSDKYSWNIFRYLKENSDRKIKVLFYTKSWVDSSTVEFNQNKTLDMMQTFIMIGDMVGTRIDSMLRNGPSKSLEIFSFCTFDQSAFIDITDWFIKEYTRVGRCIFDRNHNGWWNGSDSRFTQINKNARKCNWCGQHHKRKIIKRISINRKECWVSA